MLVLPGHGSRVSALAYSPDGRTLAAAAPASLRLWDLATGIEQLVICPINQAFGVGWSMDGMTILANDDTTTIRAWDAKSGELKGEFPFGDANSSAVLKLIGSTTSEQSEPDRLRHSEAAGWNLSFARASVLQGDISRLYISYSGEEGAPFVYNAFPHRATVDRITLDRSPSSEKNFFVPITRHGTRLGSFVPGSGIQTHWTRQSLAAFSPDGRVLATSIRRKIKLWNIEPQQRLRVLKGHGGRVRTLAFHPDGQRLLSGGHDGLVCLWNIDENGEPRRFDLEIGLINTVSFSPDGSTIAAGGMSGIVVWDVEEDPWA